MSHELQRRSFLASLSTGFLALAAVLKPRALAGAEIVRAPADEWLRNLRGRHKQVFDATQLAENVFGFANAYTMTAPAGYGVSPEEIGTVVVLRSAAIPYAFNDVIWEKYKLGEMAKLNDASGQPLTHNPIAKKGSPGVRAGGSIEELVAKGVIFGVCNLATTNRSAARASVAGVTPAEALKEWSENLVPGFTLVPSGVWAVNHAQELGCTYCSAA